MIWGTADQLSCSSCILVKLMSSLLSKVMHFKGSTEVWIRITNSHSILYERSHPRKDKRWWNCCISRTVFLDFQTISPRSHYRSRIDESLFIHWNMRVTELKIPLGLCSLTFQEELSGPYKDSWQNFPALSVSLHISRVWVDAPL